MSLRPVPLLCVVNADAHEVRALEARLRAVRTHLAEIGFDGAERSIGPAKVYGLEKPYASWTTQTDRGKFWVEHRIHPDPSGLVSIWTIRADVTVCGNFEIREPVRLDGANMATDRRELGSRMDSLNLLIRSISKTAAALSDATCGPRERLLRPRAVHEACEKTWTRLDLLARCHSPAMRCHSIRIGGLWGPNRATLMNESGRKKRVRDELVDHLVATVPHTGMLVRDTVVGDTWTLKPLDLAAVQFDHLPEPDPVETTSILREAPDGRHPARRAS